MYKKIFLLNYSTSREIAPDISFLKMFATTCYISETITFELHFSIFIIKLRVPTQMCFDQYQFRSKVSSVFLLESKMIKISITADCKKDRHNYSIVRCLLNVYNVL